MYPGPRASVDPTECCTGPSRPADTSRSAAIYQLINKTQLMVNQENQENAGIWKV